MLSVVEYGAFVRIAEGVEALIPSNELDIGTVRVGDKIKAEVSNVDTMDRRVTMTMRHPGESPQAEQLQALQREKAGQGATLGDLIKEKLGDKLSSLTGEKKE